MCNYLELIKKYEIEEELKVLLQYNFGNINAYHNLSHTLSVVKNINTLCELRDIPSDKTKLMLIAGLYHDFNHTGGVFVDKVNIKRALEAVDRFCVRSNKDKVFIKELISCTEFPFKEMELNEYQMIIRDADIMQWLEPNFIQQVLVGLNWELNKTRFLKTETIENMVNFMKNITIFTDEARTLLENGLPQVIEDCTYLIEILKEKE